MADHPDPDVGADFRDVSLHHGCDAGVGVDATERLLRGAVSVRQGPGERRGVKDGQALGAAGQRDVELAQAGRTTVGDGGGLDDEDVVVLHALGLGGGQDGHRLAFLFGDAVGLVQVAADLVEPAGVVGNDDGHGSQRAPVAGADEADGLGDGVAEQLPRLGRDRPYSIPAGLAHCPRVRQRGGDRTGQGRDELHDLGGHAVTGGQLFDAPVAVVGKQRPQAVPPGVRIGAGGLGEVAEDGHRAAPRDAAAQGASLHRREVLGLVDDDVTIAPRRLARDEVPEFFQADAVVQGPQLVLGLVRPRAVQSGLLLLVEDAVGTSAQEIRRVVETAQGLPGARRGPDTLEEALHPAVAFQAAADRAVRAATRGKGDEFPQEPVDEQAAEALATLAVGAVTAARLLKQGVDLRARDAQGRAAGGDGERRFVVLEGGWGEVAVEGLGAALVLDAAPQDGRHALVGLHQPCLRGVGAQDVAVPQAGELDGVDVAGAEGGQDLADVVEEPLVRADDEDVLGFEVVVVDEPGHAVQTDCGLARARSALHHEDVGG